VRPENPQVYKDAFTHRSVANGNQEDNEKLEFLGDAVINFLVADYLIQKLPEYNEGDLTRLKSDIVKRDNLNHLALELSLDSLLKFNKSSIKIKEGESRDMFGNALEALVGAIYLDKGFAFTKKYVNNHILKKWVDLDELISNDTNYKGMLYEYSQKEDVNIKYTFEESGKKNTPIYKSTVFIGDQILGSGLGTKKKIAEQLASKEACNKLKLLSS
jgi:ribonuclease III